MYADLHCHSTASDGELSPTELVKLAKESGLKVLALTDHDTTAGIEEAQRQGLESGIEIISGCELTAYMDKIELHILSYFSDSSTGSPLCILLDEAREGRRIRALKMGELLRASGLDIEDEDILKEGIKSSAIGMPHVGRAIVAKGHCHSINAAINRYLLPGKPGYVSKCRFSPEKVIRAIHESGGIAILAHPGISSHDELIPPMFKVGLDGIEALHASHTEINQKFYRSLAKRYERVISGGSDFHGPSIKQGLNLGDSGLSKTLLFSLRKRAQQRAREALVPASV